MKCHEKINFFVQILLPVLAEGSGEIDRNTYNRLLGRFKQETLEEIKNNYEKGIT